MTNPFEKIKDLDARCWYEEHVNPIDFLLFLERAKDKGYVLDVNSGLFVKQGFSLEIQEKLGHTSVYIIFPRPVNLHYHEDVDEAFHIIDGTGTFYTQFEKSEREECIFPGREILMPKKRAHSFMPNFGECLEMRIECSGILDPKKEICVSKFTEYGPIKEYYDRVERDDNGLANGHFPKNGKNHNHSR